LQRTQGANLFKNTKISTIRQGTTRDHKEHKLQGSKFIYKYKDFSNSVELRMSRWEKNTEIGFLR